MERQLEILRFRPQKLYGVRISVNGVDMMHKDEFLESEKADKIIEQLRGKTLRLVKATKKTEK